MALSLASKGAVRFEWTDADGDMAGVITISPGDDEETIKRKLRKILALAGEEQSMVKLDPITPPDGWSPTATRTFGSVPAAANGWAAMAAAPELPDRLQGEVELYGPEEQG